MIAELQAGGALREGGADFLDGLGAVDHTAVVRIFREF